MKKTAFLIFFLSMNVLADVAENVRELEECLWTGAEKACKPIAAKQKANANFYDSALKSIENKCETDYEKCYLFFSYSGILGKKHEAAAIKRLAELCEKNVESCLGLTFAYEKTKEIPKALAAAKKYFDVSKRGPYILLAYNNKTDLKAVFEASLADCRSNNQLCLSYLRAMPDHPQHQELVTLSDFACKNSNGLSVGATACAVVGAYFYKIKNFEKAQESWASDCKNNGVSCMLILGAEDLPAPSKRQALKTLCDTSPSSVLGNDNKLIEFLCEGKTGGKYDGSPLATASNKGRAILQEYLQAQK
jgi:hypothetical protein